MTCDSTVMDIPKGMSRQSKKPKSKPMDSFVEKVVKALRNPNKDEPTNEDKRIIGSWCGVRIVSYRKR